MCGPSAGEKNISGEQSAFYNQLMQSYQQNFGAQSNILGALTSNLTPILNAGPNQQGFSPQESAALNTNAIQTTGQGYKNAAQALGTQIGSEGGGNEFVPNGASDQLKAGLATSASNQLDTEQNQNLLANYSQGRANWQTALSGLSGTAQIYNPSSIAGNANNAGNSAFGSANQIAQQEAQEQQAIAGGITGAVGGGLTMGLGALSGAGSFLNQSGNGFLNFLGNLGGN